jgi:hypothetical protein
MLDNLRAAFSSIGTAFEMLIVYELCNHSSVLYKALLPEKDKTIKPKNHPPGMHIHILRKSNNRCSWPI